MGNHAFSADNKVKKGDLKMSSVVIVETQFSYQQQIFKIFPHPDDHTRRTIWRVLLWVIRFGISFVSGQQG